MAYNRSHSRYMRRGRFDRLRHRRQFEAFLVAQDARLTASRTSQTVAPVHTSEADAVATLTFGANAANTKIVTIGSTVYTFKTALTEAKATSTFTVGGGGSVIQDADTLTINGKVYTWQTSLTNVDGHVLIGANDTAALLNMLRAITLGTASGTSYAAATTAHPTVTASSSNATTLVITALSVGVAGNALTTAESSSGSWGSNTAHLTGGVDAVTFEVKISGVNASGSLDALIAAINHDSGEGTTYSTGTTAHPSVTAAAGAGDTMDVAAAGAAGNQVEVSTDISMASWGDTHLTGGVTEAFGPTWTATSHPYSDFDGPFQLSTATTLPAGTNTSELYWVHVVDANKVKLGKSIEDLLNEAYVTVTDAGTGAHALKRSVVPEGMFELVRRNGAVRVKAATDIDSLS